MNGRARPRQKIGGGGIKSIDLSLFVNNGQTDKRTERGRGKESWNFYRVAEKGGERVEEERERKFSFYYLKKWRTYHYLMIVMKIDFSCCSYYHIMSVYYAGFVEENCYFLTNFVCLSKLNV